ncbi:group II intron, maturase-specific domain protein [Leptospira noguchii str. 1993005606]|nr:group II intron, maturase-specific domain protein [Leptospira noguchii str. 1993005606]
MKSIRSKIRNLTTRRWYRLSLEEIVKNLNPVIRGWRNYFRAVNYNAGLPPN